ncbi:hypothetical protein [Caviibacterium pharyngocola]|uniref:Uncharacterized protein n=1 Tax=Caviibacterium pharyngocola TaxID=28159 RepID=A0A2M8RV77_9PAST|nr:hypothetical protein [Caviibacterium pharyngocola]PJG82784.1 hypothetical protein CVP04_07420 [Caviibacterium pharyngocola]
METREAEQIIEHHRLFNVGPRIQALSFFSDQVRSDLIQFCHLIQAKIGQGKSLNIYPHRILQQGMWAVQLVGEQDKIHLLLNIAGRFKLTIPTENEPWPVRWQIDIADHIDAYWFTELLSQELKLEHTVIHLSTKSVDKQGERIDETGKINS